jgi:hypothetical protein
VVAEVAFLVVGLVPMLLLMPLMLLALLMLLMLLMLLLMLLMLLMLLLMLALLALLMPELAVPVLALMPVLLVLWLGPWPRPACTGARGPATGRPTYNNNEKKNKKTTLPH